MQNISVYGLSNMLQELQRCIVELEFYLEFLLVVYFLPLKKTFMP